MKKIVAKTAFYCAILGSLMSLPITSSAIDLFDTNTGYLVIPEVDVNGDTFYDNVTFKLDFASGKFELVSFEEKPETISTTTLATMEEQDIKMDFMGCVRSGRNEVTCHLKLTSLGGFDRKLRVIGTNYLNSSNKTRLYDDKGNTYIASEVIVGNLQSSSAVKPNLIAGIPTLAKFKFINISPEASSLSLFQPEFTGDIDFNGDFRNINF